MIDASDVARFAAVLDAPVLEEPWRDEWLAKVAEEWRNSVEVDTGEYRDSIHVTPEGAASSAKHSVFNEYGTAHMAPQPALNPAINRLSRRAAADLGDRVIRQLT